jgi:hypothetical protein
MGREWDELVARYGVDTPPQGTVLSGHTVQIGEGLFAPIYKNCTTVGASAAGLYIGANVILGLALLKPVLVPWNAIRRVEPATLYWQRAARVSIGDPEITPVILKMDAYRIIAEYLQPAQRMPE